jgi:ElaB/YqjD/DUF883 family membrane-anchored ribosome-binding protein
VLFQAQAQAQQVEQSQKRLNKLGDTASETLHSPADVAKAAGQAADHLTSTALESVAEAAEGIPRQLSRGAAEVAAGAEGAVRRAAGAASNALGGGSSASASDSEGPRAPATDAEGHTTRPGAGIQTGAATADEGHGGVSEAAVPVTSGGAAAASGGEAIHADQGGDGGGGGGLPAAEAEVAGGDPAGLTSARERAG